MNTYSVRISLKSRNQVTLDLILSIPYIIRILLGYTLAIYESQFE